MKSLVAVAVVCFILIQSDAQAANTIASYDCRFTEEPIEIDGDFDDAWNQAVPITEFSLPWLGQNNRKPDKATTAWMLWDREYLYIYATMIDADIYADIDQRDGKIWDNDVIELFLKPSVDKPAYYEFQVSALNTQFDAFFHLRGQGNGSVEKYDYKFESAVKHDGTLNIRTDTDRSWSAEMRIPWTSAMLTGGRPEPGEEWRFALCRYDHTVQREQAELTTCAPLSSLPYPNFHWHEDYCVLRFLGPDPPSASGAWGVQTFSPIAQSKVIGTPDPPLPYHVVKAYPKLKISYPIAAKIVPGTDDLLFVDATQPYAPTKLCRIKDQADVTAYETLLDSDSSVVYDLCFDPNYRLNGFLYLGSNGPDDKGERYSRITRYFLDPEPPYRLDADSATTIIHWKSAGHNGAAIDFGPDGMLYVTTGDGTSDSDSDNVGQRLDTLLGKVLRIDVNTPNDDRMYSVPSDNPFVGHSDARPETWAYGLRNPWRLSIDHRTGNVWVGNNGQDLWEQVYRVERGANYGWSVFEGSHPFYMHRELRSKMSNPIFEHPHSEARSLTGGVVYYGTRLPELHGAYIYGDYSTGKIWAGLHDGQRLVWHKPIADTQLAITGFVLDSDGELMVLDHRADGDGNFYHLEAAPESEFDHRFPMTLSETGLFLSTTRQEVSPSLIPYSVNSPQWSSGASQNRFLGLFGADASIATHAVNAWGFPNRTVLMKTLSIETQVGDPASIRPVETQLLTIQEGEWAGYSYAWNEDATDAVLVGAEGKEQMFEVRDGKELRQQNWRFSSRTECMNCHSRAAGFTIGMTTMQLNRDHDYGNVTDNQLRVWEHLGILSVDWRDHAKQQLQRQLRKTGMALEAARDEVESQMRAKDAARPQSSRLLSPAAQQQPRLPGYDQPDVDLDQRARSWLHGNCAHCHISSGGGNAQIDLHFNTEQSRRKLFDVEPVHSTFAIPRSKLIVPGHPHRSILYYRLATAGSGRMPQSGSETIDQASVSVVRRWIESMEPSHGDERDAEAAAIALEIAQLSESNLGTEVTDEIAATIDSLLSTTTGALILITEIEEGKIKPALQEKIVSRASSHDHAPARDLFERFVPLEQRVRRLGMIVDADDILSRMGNEERGRLLFEQGTVANCKSCHHYGDGPELLGPGLADISGRMTRAEILDSILYPSRKVDDKYRSYLIVTKDGRLLTGRVVRQDDQSLVLRDLQNNESNFSHDDIEEMLPSEQSMMPSSLVQGMTAEQLADLLAFLESVK